MLPGIESGPFSVFGAGTNVEVANGANFTGGIAQKIVPALKAGTFRAAFEDKAPHSEMMKATPVYVITHPLAALAGLAAYARSPESFGVETSGRRWRTGEKS